MRGGRRDGNHLPQGLPKGAAQLNAISQEEPLEQRPVIVFDVNETLLDLDTLRPFFEQVFGDAAAMRLWFANLITYSEALTLAGVYVPFTDIGGAVLAMLAATRGTAIGAAEGAEFGDLFASMPPTQRSPPPCAGCATTASGFSR